MIIYIFVAKGDFFNVGGIEFVTKLCDIRSDSKYVTMCLPFQHEISCMSYEASSCIGSY